MHILQQCFRVHVESDKLESTIRFYEGLQGSVCERRVNIPETHIQAAKVGGFLILAGDKAHLEAVSYVDAVFYLDALDDFHPWLVAQSAELLHGPRGVTGGRNMTVRHPDGLVVEYFQAG